MPSDFFFFATSAENETSYCIRNKNIVGTFPLRWLKCKAKDKIEGKTKSAACVKVATEILVGTATRERSGDDEEREHFIRHYLSLRRMEGSKGGSY